MPSRAVRVSLPGGFWRGGQHQREVLLRPVTGQDETFLLESADSLLPSQRITQLLARCLAADGATVGDEAGRAQALDLARVLSVGDREALVLQLRQLTMGDELACSLTCPALSCGKPMELPLRASALLVPAYDAPAPSYEETIRAGGTSYRVRYRVPTGADQELAAEAARHDGGAAVRLLIERCVEEVQTESGERVSALPEDAVAELSGAMIARDPQAELELEVCCPECASTFTVLFDAGGFLLQELQQRVERLLREVHTLAWHYHWSEQDILHMSSRRRAHYLNLLSESVASRSASRV